jgi:hypothetical protein
MKSMCGIVFLLLSFDFSMLSATLVSLCHADNAVATHQLKIIKLVIKIGKWGFGLSTTFLLSELFITKKLFILISENARDC